MGELNLEDSAIKDMTVEDFIEAVIALEPALKLVELLKKTQNELAHEKQQHARYKAILSVVVQERDAAIERTKKNT